MQDEATVLPAVGQHIIDFVKNHTRNESFLYNNRCFFFFINPSEFRKAEYDVNYRYIHEYFANGN